MPALHAIGDVLLGLLDCERSSPFAQAVAARPYAGPDGIGIRRGLAYIAEADERRAGDLWAAMLALGLEPDPAPPRLQAIEPFLSMAYVLPPLIKAKQATLQAYRDAIAALDGVGDELQATLRRHLTEHAGELQLLIGEA